jgi:hypothetical protein
MFGMMLVAMLVSAAPTRAASPISTACAGTEGSSGGGPGLLQTTLFVFDTFYMGETITVDITLAGATQVDLRIPQPTVVDSLFANGQLSYTFPADTYIAGMDLIVVGPAGFYYTWHCTAAPEVPVVEVEAVVEEPVPGPDMVAIPVGAVVGTFTTTTALYWSPDAADATSDVMLVGQSLWVYGLDSSGAFYQVLLSGKTYWVPVGAVGPTFDAVWNGTPLPTTIVE